MNRDEYMRQLEHLLLDIPAEEREEALRYYKDYFDDAGVTEEARIMEELGSPEKIAKLIKNNLYGRANSEAGEYTESGYRNPYDDEDSKTPATYAKTNTYREDTISEDRSKTILIVVLVVLSAPIWMSILGAAFGIVIGICGALFGITVGFGGACIGLFVGGIVLCVMGIGQLVYYSPTGVMMIGASFILIALGMLFLIITILIVGKLIPAIVKGVTSLCSKLYHKTRRAVA